MQISSSVKGPGGCVGGASRRVGTLMADGRGPPPLCQSCTHNHFPGEKCPICGHTGKGKAFMISKTTGPSSMELHFECFDKRVDAKTYKSQWALTRIMRCRVFVEECGVPEAQEFDGHDDSSRHVLGLVGDAPVVYARWRLENDSSGGVETRVAVIDRIIVLLKHRQKGFANTGLDFLFRDVMSTVTELQTQIAGVVVVPPVDPPLIIEKMQRRGFVPCGEPYMERGHAFQRLFLAITQPPGGGAPA